MSSQPWSDSQVHGFFHLLFSREMFPNHQERRVPAVGSQCAARGARTESTSMALALGRGPFAKG